MVTPTPTRLLPARRCLCWSLTPPSFLRLGHGVGTSTRGLQKLGGRAEQSPLYLLAYLSACISLIVPSAPRGQGGGGGGGLPSTANSNGSYSSELNDREGCLARIWPKQLHTILDGEGSKSATSLAQQHVGHSQRKAGRQVTEGAEHRASRQPPRASARCKCTTCST